MPRVSVLMPTHNRADVVGLAIDSVLAQTMADFELLVVADGCSDRTFEILGQLRDDRVRVFDLPKAPHFGYANRNVALREARGDVIAFAAHDDLLFPDHLEQLVGAMEETSAEWMYSRPLWVSPDGLVVPFCTNLTVPDELDDFLSGHNTIPASAVVYHRRCLGRDGFWPEHLPHSGDRDYWHRIIEGGARARFGYSPVPTCLHFKAAWKTTRDAESGEMREWLAVADSASWWPEALAIRPADGETEQAACARAMAAPGWSRRVRTAVAMVIDRVAWHAIRRALPERRAFDAERLALRTEYERLDVYARSVEAHLRRDLEAARRSREAR